MIPRKYKLAFGQLAAVPLFAVTCGLTIWGVVFFFAPLAPVIFAAEVAFFIYLLFFRER